MTLLPIQFAVISRGVRQKAFVFHPISLNVQNPDVQHKPVNTFVSGLLPLSAPCPLPLGRPDTQANENREMHSAELNVTNTTLAGGGGGQG